MFRTFSSEQLLDLVAMMSKNEVKAGTELIVQGDLGSKFYVVHFGGFDVLVQKAASEPARRVAHFGPASWFGEPALLYGSKRGATVKATKDSVVWALDREQYKWVLMAENRKVRDGTRLGRRTPHTHAQPRTTHPASPPSAGPRRRVPRVERRLARRAGARREARADSGVDAAGRVRGRPGGVPQRRHGELADGDHEGGGEVRAADRGERRRHAGGGDARRGRDGGGGLARAGGPALAAAHAARGGALAAALPAGQLARGVGDGGGHAPLRVHVGVGVCQFPRLAPRRDRHPARHRHAVQGPRDLPELHAARAPRNSAQLWRNYCAIRRTCRAIL